MWEEIITFLQSCAHQVRTSFRLKAEHKGQHKKENKSSLIKSIEGRICWFYGSTVAAFLCLQLKMPHGPTGWHIFSWMSSRCCTALQVTPLAASPSLLNMCFPSPSGWHLPGPKKVVKTDKSVGGDRNKSGPCVAVNLSLIMGGLVPDEESGSVRTRTRRSSVRLTLVCFYHPVAVATKSNTVQNTHIWCRLHQAIRKWKHCVACERLLHLRSDVASWSLAASNERHCALSQVVTSP